VAVAARDHRAVRPVPAISQKQFGAFSRQQALECGWTRSALLHALQAGQLHAVRRGVFVATDVMDGVGVEAEKRRLMASTAAVLLATPAAVASHASAAVLADLPVWRLPERPCVTVPPRHTGDAGTVHLHRAALPIGDCRAAGALVRTSAARTICDLAREHGIENAVVAADAALERGLLTVDDLERCLRDCARWPGIRRARTAVELVDGRAESPLESVSRLRLGALDLPRPDLQPELISFDGIWLGRVDFFWHEYGVAGEVDGRLKYADGDALWKEKLRQEQLEEAGVIVVRWGRAQLGNMPRLAERLYGAFGRGQRRTADERRWIVRANTDFAL
jgi:hypothetical protein